MSELELIDRFYVDAEFNYIKYLREAFIIARSVSEKTPDFLIPLPDGISSKTTNEMSKIESLLHSAYVLAELRGKLSEIEIILFEECVHRSKEAVLYYNDPVLHAYYIGVFSKYIQLLKILMTDEF